MQQKQINDISMRLALLLIVLAYIFSVGARMYWPIYFSANDAFHYNNILMINTNDGYFFASGAKDILNSITPEDKQRVSAVSYGLSQITAFITQWTSFKLETVILYLSAFVSSLLVIPIVLTGRLMGHTVLGFLSALIGGIAWSYYNRTMVGYYDSDMFAILLQFSIFYTFLYVAYKKDLRGIIISSLLIFVYPYFYPQGLSITYAMFIMLVLYLILERKGIIKTKETKDFQKDSISLYGSIMLLSITLMMTLPVWIRIIAFGIVLALLLAERLKQKHFVYLAVILFMGFLYFGNILGILLPKLAVYVDRGVEIEGLHFYQVIQTVREAGAIPMATIANRISGSSIGLLVSFIGFILLILRHKPFVIAIPLIGIGLFSYVGGLRFTVYAVPVAALGAVYFFWIVGSFLNSRSHRYILVILGTIGMLYPNIDHIVGYKVPTVLNQAEVADLVKLNEISSRKDYTLAWWDYGYPIWYYSDTSTLIDGGKHHNDNFIVSKILQTSSAELAASLSRLSVETYIDSNYSTVTDTLFKNQQKDQLDPNVLLSELNSNQYNLPKKTRDIYLYLPYRMMNIFPTVAVFGNLDLTTGKAERRIAFYPSYAVKNDNGVISLQNGIVFDTKKGEITLGKQKKYVRYFIATQNTKQGKVQSQSQLQHTDGEYVIVYMKSYGRFVVMDTEIFKSTYVQMFMLEKYDKDLFELVVSSPYSKIYKLKK